MQTQNNNKPSFFIKAIAIFIFAIFIFLFIINLVKIILITFNI